MSIFKMLNIYSIKEYINANRSTILNNSNNKI